MAKKQYKTFTIRSVSDVPAMSGFQREMLVHVCGFDIRHGESFKDVQAIMLMAGDGKGRNFNKDTIAFHSVPNEFMDKVLHVFTSKSEYAHAEITFKREGKAWTNVMVDTRISD